MSFAVDTRLQDLTDFVLAAPGVSDDAEDGFYEKIVAIGAGCTRHYIKHALAA